MKRIDEDTFEFSAGEINHALALYARARLARIAEATATVLQIATTSGPIGIVHFGASNAEARAWLKANNAEWLSRSPTNTTRAIYDGGEP